MDSITLYKNNELIMRTSSGVLQYNTTTSSQYGRYQCVVEKKVSNVEKNLLLQEEGNSSALIFLVIFVYFKATFNIKLQVDDCSMWTVSTSMRNCVKIKVNSHLEFRCTKSRRKSFKVIFQHYFRKNLFQELFTDLFIFHYIQIKIDLLIGRWCSHCIRSDKLSEVTSSNRPYYCSYC